MNKNYFFVNFTKIIFVKMKAIKKDINIIFFPKFFFTEFEELTLDKLDVVATLGIGGFGRVALVQMAKDKR